MNIRVTQNAVSRQYKNNMNKTFSQMNALSDKVINKRKLTRASENTVSAARALMVRKNLSNIDTYDDNLSQASSILSSAEDTLNTITKEVTTVTTKINSAITDSKSEGDRKIIATEIRNVAKNMLKEMNSDFADRNVFGGTNDSSVAFTYDETSGKVSFNGVEINTNTSFKDSSVPAGYHFGGTDVTAAVLQKTATPFADAAAATTAVNTFTGAISSDKTYYVSKDDVDITYDAGGNPTAYKLKTPTTADPAATTDITSFVGTGAGKINVSDKLVTSSDSKVYLNSTEITEAQANGNNYSRFPETGSILIDVGIGIAFNKDGTVDPSTVMDISLNGAELTGSGTDSDGDSLNMIQLTFDAAKALDNNDVPTARRLMDKISAAKSTMLIGVTNLGVKEQAVEYNKDKVAEDKLNLQAVQTNVEGMTELDLTEALTEYKEVQSAYNATLQMGSSVVPTSIFDFMN